jgi:hypothetical protein
MDDVSVPPVAKKGLLKSSVVEPAALSVGAVMTQ